MIDKLELQVWIAEALKAAGGKAKIIWIAEHIWKNHKSDLEDAGSLFYTWQYDMRWAATELRRKGILCQADDVPRGVWMLAIGT